MSRRVDRELHERQVRHECSVCHERLGADDFGIRFSREHVYRSSRCLACDRAYGLRRYRLKRDEIRPLNRAYKRTVGARLRKRAHDRVARALRTGRLTRQPCEACGDEPVHAHHDDYDRPLEVRWLCSRHHGEAHRATREERVFAMIQECGGGALEGEGR